MRARSANEMQDPPRAVRRRTSGQRPSLAFASIAALLVATSIAHAEIRVTSSSGASHADGTPLTQHSTVASGEVIKVDKRGRASIYAANTVVNLCNGAKMKFQTEASDGAQILGISEGEIKASAGPRGKGSRLEIHTPVAIATLLGTAVHVEVDPETGDTIITSLEHRVRVENIDDALDGYVILSPGDQVVVRKDSAPNEVSKVDPGDFKRSSRCLDDEEFRRSAILIDHKATRLASIAMITAMDVPASPHEIPSVSLEASTSPMLQSLSASTTGSFDPIDGGGCAGRCDDHTDAPTLGDGFPPPPAPAIPIVPPPPPPPPIP
jgi:hypothetical protein